MVQDFFHDLMTLVSEVENRSSCQNEEKGILREKCQESVRTLIFFKDTNGQWAYISYRRSWYEIFKSFTKRYAVELRSSRQRSRSSLAVLNTTRPSTSKTGKVGRPKVEISEETLLNLRTLGFIWARTTRRNGRPTPKPW